VTSTIERRLPLALAAWLAAAPAGATVPEAYQDLSLHYALIEAPAPAAFSVCHRHTCAEVSGVGLTPAQWDLVRQIFTPPAANAAAERAMIRAAVGQLETAVSPLVGAENDRAGNLSGFLSGSSQMDCIDESTNTTTYLTMMQRDGLLRWHRVANPSTRGFIIFGWPHTTAVVEEVASGERWAVDSWFHDNGVPPEVLPIDQWKSGWAPEGFPGF
jgi:hypothetical protein